MKVDSKICAVWLLTILAFGFTPKNSGAQSASADAARGNVTQEQAAKKSEIHTPKPGGPPLQVLSPIDPWTFKADGKWHLVYELQVTNLGKWYCLLTRLDAVTGDSGAKPIASYSGTELEGMIDRPGQTVSEKAKIEPGAFAIVYMWLTFDKTEDVPAKVSHRIAMKIGDYPEGSRSMALPFRPTGHRLW